MKFQLIFSGSGITMTEMAYPLLLFSGIFRYPFSGILPVPFFFFHFTNHI